MKSGCLSQQLFDARESFANNPGAIMGKIVGNKKFAELYARYESTYRRRVLTPLITLSMFVLQAVDTDKAQRKAVATMMTHLANKKLPNGSRDASAYCQARQRLPTSLLVEPTQMLAANGAAGAPGLVAWPPCQADRRQFVLDARHSRKPDVLRAALRAEAWLRLPRSKDSWALQPDDRRCA
jgi:hypothetical protein